ncbi:hypothetical protein HMPREF9511_01713 [Enterococcus faecalis TX0630]|uniref:Uncharacterized protein n=1 Tax=Enterococcus faecalis TX0630 TaxID=749508 RepID=A0ABC9P5X7_ENTFL|nr:conserved hypothetical protein [Enterococcus faecalis T8]EFU90300.1 hypothetical protein HMPREF9511_01713 [Enterococcus faecalis TX0630]
MASIGKSKRGSLLFNGTLSTPFFAITIFLHLYKKKTSDLFTRPLLFIHL